MSTSSRLAVTATLVVGAVIGLVGVRSLWEIQSQPALNLRLQVMELFRPDLSRTVEPLQAQFVPDPSDPPTGTGGSGTR
jgi:hypothetical protein